MKDINTILNYIRENDLVVESWMLNYHSYSLLQLDVEHGDLLITINRNNKFNVWYEDGNYNYHFTDTDLFGVIQSIKKKFID